MDTHLGEDALLFLDEIPDDKRKIVKKLFDTILSVQPDLAAAVKWNRLTFAVNHDFHHWICGISVMKTKVALVFHFGGLLNDDRHVLMAATSIYFRKIEYDTEDDVLEEDVKYFIDQAVEKLPYFKENWKELNKKS